MTTEGREGAAPPDPSLSSPSTQAVPLWGKMGRAAKPTAQRDPSHQPPHDLGETASFPQEESQAHLSASSVQHLEAAEMRLLPVCLLIH